MQKAGMRTKYELHAERARIQEDHLGNLRIKSTQSLRHAAYVDDTGELGVRSEGTADLLSCRGTRYHLLITGLGDGR